MREIRTLRARWRGLETELRVILFGHEAGNRGHRQGRPCGPPRQSPTLLDRAFDITGAGRASPALGVRG